MIIFYNHTKNWCDYGITKTTDSGFERDVKRHVEEVWMRYSFGSPEYLTVEEAKEWVFCIAYFLQDNPCQEKEIVIKPPPPSVRDVPDAPDDPIEIVDWSFSEGTVERRVFRLYREFSTIFWCQSMIKEPKRQ